MTVVFLCFSDTRQALLTKVASVREVVLGAPLRLVLKHLASRSLAPDMDQLVALVHRPNESFFLYPQVRLLILCFLRKSWNFGRMNILHRQIFKGLNLHVYLSKIF